MRNLSVPVALGLLVPLSVLGLWSCVGDAPIVVPPDGGDAASQPDVVDAGQPPADASADADATALTCDAGTTVCGSSCVDLATSGDNCGVCNHSCGGATCLAGACQSMTVASAVAGLNDYALDQTYVYLAAGNYIERCSKAGPCTGGDLTKIADFTGVNPDGTGSLSAANGRVAFVGNTAGNARLYECAGTGCTSLTYFGGLSQYGYDSMDLIQDPGDGGVTNLGLVRNPYSGILGFSCTSGVCTSPTVRLGKANESAFLGANLTDYFYQSATGVGTCPRDEAPCAAPSTIASGITAKAFAVTGPYIYMNYVAGNGKDTIGRCPVAGCSGAPTVVRATYTTVDAMTAGGTQVYYFDDASSIWTLHGCDASNCTTPKDLATTSHAPVKLLLDAQFFYWSDTTGNIQRIAR